MALVAQCQDSEICSNKTIEYFLLVDLELLIFKCFCELKENGPEKPVAHGCAHKHTWFSWK